MMSTIYARKSFLHSLPMNFSFIGKSIVCFPLPVRYWFTSQPATAAAVSELLLHKRQFSLSENTQKSDNIPLFFKEIGLSDSQLKKIFKSRRQLLSASLDKSIKPKIRTFQDFGFSPNEIAIIITKEPAILCCSASKRVIPSLSTLKGLLGSTVDVARVLGNYGYLLSMNLDNTMVPNIEFLKSFGISVENIRHFLYAQPIILLHRPEAFREIVEKVDQMGVDASSKSFIRAVRIVGSMSNETWELKLQAFRDLGFSDIEIVEMFRKLPQAFGVSVAKLRRVTEVVIGSGKYDLSSVANTPISLTCSIEKRFIPRFRILEKMNEKKWPALVTVCVLSDANFLGRYAVPYLNQVGHKHALQTAVSMLKEAGN